MEGEMTYLRLKTDILTYDKQMLLQAGTDISDEVLKDIISINKNRSFKSYSLMLHESIRKDLLQCISQAPYQWIFSLGDEYRALLKFMEKVHLVEPVLQNLDYLQQYDADTYRHSLTVFTLSTLVATYLIKNYREHLSEVMGNCRRL